MGYDVVVRGGTIVDGSGGPSYIADVGIQGGKIVSIGKITDARAQNIDADGMVVCPGFIDVHTHLDCQLFWEPLGSSSCWQGVTTAVMGNCGFTLAPARENEKDFALGSFERAEDIPLATMHAGIPWSWETFPEYFDTIEARPKGINYASYVGHCAIRTYVMGKRAFTETATDDDLTAMCRVLEDSIRAGAWGFSTTRSVNHRMMNDDPVPSRLADWSEVRALVGRMGELGTGVFSMTPEWYDSDPERTMRWFDSLKVLALESGRPFTMACGQREPLGWSYFAKFFEEVAQAGGRVYGQVGTRLQVIVLGFKLALPFDRLPGWKAFRSQPLEEQRSVLTDPAHRERLVLEALNGEYKLTVLAEPQPPEYEHILIVDSPEGPWRSVAEVAVERGTTPVDVMIDLSLESNFEQLFAHAFANRDREQSRQMLSHPLTLVGDADSGAHASQICDASFYISLLTRWARDDQVFTLEQAIRNCTWDPARWWGFTDRGLVREGLAADLLVIDLDSLSPGDWKVDYGLPAGAKRIMQKASGIRTTIVNGEIFLNDGEHTGAFPGKLLRGRLAAAP